MTARVRPTHFSKLILEIKLSEMVSTGTMIKRLKKINNQGPPRMLTKSKLLKIAQKPNGLPF